MSKNVVLGKSSEDFWISPEALKEMRGWNVGSIISDFESIPTMTCGDYIVSRNIADHATNLSKLKEFNNEKPIKKCICDFHTIIMVTGCQCGGE